ncbi:MAG: hypothetical protein WC291_12325 [Thermodesulfovibrionales bacterium]
MTEERSTIHVEPGDQEAKKLAFIIYALYAAALFIGITSIVGIIMAYVTRERVAGTWVESHYIWLIKTFWISLAVGIVGVISLIVGIGFVILGAGLIWYIYRIVKGGWYLYENRAM